MNDGTKKPYHPSRRQLLQTFAATSALGTLHRGPWGALIRAASMAGAGAGTMGGLDIGTQSAQAAEERGPVPRLVLIFLDGGWNNYFAIDPVYGKRLTNGAFESVFASHTLRAPPSKPNLLTGIGFQDALPAFDSIPTVFVNGLNVEIAAHDAAANYLLTGRSAIGRTLTEPAVTAVIATKRGGLASHLVLGGSVPLGETIQIAAPLMTTGNALGGLLTPPGSQFKEETRQALEEALSAHNQVFFSSLGDKAIASLQAFVDSQKDVSNAFKNFANKLNLDDEMKTRYDVASNGNMGDFAAAWLALKHDLTTIVSIRFGGFDTHTNELNSQLPLQRQVALALNAFVADLRATPDPRDPQNSLADTTTIVLTSEFTRTAKFNDTAGTDHQNSASAIIMGRGVRDNRLIGGTSETGEVMGWDGEKPVTKTEETMIDGSTLVATLLDQFGLGEVANQVSSRRIRGIF